MKLRLISAADMDQALGMAEAVDINAAAFMALSAGESITPLRQAMETPNGITLLKPAYLKDTKALAVKIVTVFPKNPGIGLPRVQAMVLVFDGRTGTPMAIMDGTRLTNLRTGAASGAATRLLARPESHSLALFGAGAAAPDQAEAMLAVRPISLISIYTPSRTSAQALAERLSQAHPGVEAHAAKSPREAVTDADIICCATTSREPVFDPAQVRPGTHINGVGSFTPDMREVQVRGLAGSRIFVDSLESALAEAGDLIQAMEEWSIRQDDIIELGHVLSGQGQGRTSDAQITFFKSVGTAVQDVATAQAVMAKAERLGLGTEVEM